MFNRYSNICANLLPRQIAKQYDRFTLEHLTDVRITNDGDPVRPTIIVFHPNDTYDTFQWLPNPVSEDAFNFPNVWTMIESGQQAEAA